MGMDGRLGRSGGSRRIKPECHIVSHGRRGLQFSVGVSKKVFDGSQVSGCSPSDNDLVQTTLDQRDRLFVQRQKFIIDEQHLRAAVLDHEGKITGGRARAKSYRDRAATHDAEMRGDEVRAVLQKQERPVALRQVRTKRIAKATYV